MSGGAALDEHCHRWAVHAQPPLLLCFSTREEMGAWSVALQPKKAPTPSKAAAAPGVTSAAGAADERVAAARRRLEAARQRAAAERAETARVRRELQRVRDAYALLVEEF